jgi:uncharacterized protein (TIGR02996 family)
MTEREGLLRAICEAPDDDAPRLVYADWLDEHGDPLQAQFIRVQIELARLSKDERRRHSLAATIASCSDFRKWRYVPGHWPKLNLDRFERGFNTFWSGSAQEFLVAAPAYWRLGPVEEIIVWVERRNEATTTVAHEVATSEWLQHVRDLRVSGRSVSDEWVLELSRAAAGKWRRLVIEGSRLSDAACHSLVTSVLVSTGCTLVVHLSGRISGRNVDQLISAFGDRLSLAHGPGGRL